MLITKMALPRRTFLRGLGASVALPLLDAMAPAMSAQTRAALRFAAIYVGNGANMSDWTPAGQGGRSPFVLTVWVELLMIVFLRWGVVCLMTQRQRG